MDSRSELYCSELYMYCIQQDDIVQSTIRTNGWIRDGFRTREIAHILLTTRWLVRGKFGIQRRIRKAGLCLDLMGTPGDERHKSELEPS